jgi:uncharacterized hydrophobic protein (TIGR00341 family)
MKIVEVIVDASYQAITREVVDKHEAMVLWEDEQDDRRIYRLLVASEKRQAFLDELQGHLHTSPNTLILVTPVEAVLPPPPKAAPEPGQKKKRAVATREELYSGVEKNAELNGTYLILVLLSTIVAAIGLIEDSVAVVIGAMVIAPLLGPNIALALATTLGDVPLMIKSLKTSGAGLGLALLLSVLIGWGLPVDLTSKELMARTVVGLDSVVLAMASGGAAVLSLTTGLPSVLVGVMVAVALLPPTATVGMMLGGGYYDLAGGAALLLAVNVVAVNLSAKVTFLARGISPRTKDEKLKARQSMEMSLVIWVVTLAILIGVILLKP